MPACLLWLCLLCSEAALRSSSAWRTVVRRSCRGRPIERTARLPVLSLARKVGEGFWGEGCRSDLPRHPKEGADLGSWQRLQQELRSWAGQRRHLAEWESRIGTDWWTTRFVWTVFLLLLHVFTALSYHALFLCNYFLTLKTPTWSLHWLYAPALSFHRPPPLPANVIVTA